MSRPPLPSRIERRADVEALLAAATNYEERMPWRSGRAAAFDTRRTEALLEAVGSPHRVPWTTAHVAGSKGKGSTARFLASALLEGGRGPVGLYLSPHLEDLSERIQVDGHPIGEALLAFSAEALRPYVASVQGTDQAPTFFEILTAMAFVAFERTGCNAIVLETGVGGRLDATNVCFPAVTVITSIEREHTALLGERIEDIAGEKAGIVKAAVPVLTSARSPALEIIERRAALLRAPLGVLRRDFDVLEALPSGEGTVARCRSTCGALVLEIRAPGAHLAANALLAFEASRLLGLEVSDARRGIARTFLPGHLEVLARSPTVRIDGAHTPGSAEALARTFRAWFPQETFVLLFACLKEKNVEAILSSLLPLSVAVVATQVDSPRSHRAGDLARAIEVVAAPGLPVEAVEDVSEALERARACAGPKGSVLATGSLYLAGNVRRLLRTGAGTPAPG